MPFVEEEEEEEEEKEEEEAKTMAVTIMSHETKNEDI